MAEKVLAGSHEYALQKREQMFAKLAKNKWWNQGYDPRPIHPDDNVRIMGKENLAVKFQSPEMMEEFIAAHPDFEVGKHIGAEKYGIMAQPGFHVLHGSNDNPYQSDIFIQKLGGDTIRVSRDEANRTFQRPNMSAAQEIHMAERAYPVETRQTNLEAFQEIFEQEGMDDPRLALAYSWMAGMFQHGNLSLDDIEILQEALPFIEWQRRHNPSVEEDIFKPYNFSAPKRHEHTGHLQDWYDGLANQGLDPVENKVYWDSPAVWSHGGFEIALLSDNEDEFISHGTLLGHCVNETDDRPYFAMHKEGHWPTYALRDKTGRPCATICMHQSQDNVWTIMENRDKSYGLDENNPKVAGKSLRYRDVIGRWFDDMEKLGVKVDRSSENQYAPSAHPEFGLSHFGYHPESTGHLREDDPDEWEVECRDMNDRLGDFEVNTIQDLYTYYTELKNHPEHFFDSEQEADRQNRVNYYYPANRLQFRQDDLENILTEVCDIDPVQRTDTYINDIIFKLNLVIKHKDAMEYKDNRDITIDELVEYAISMATDDVADNLSIRRAHYREPVENEAGQRDLGFDENDIKTWPIRISELLEKSNSFDWDIVLPTPHDEYTTLDLDQTRSEFETHMKLDGPVLKTKPQLDYIQKTDPDAAQKELFVPITEGDRTPMPHLNNDKITQERAVRWRRFYQNEISVDMETKELIRGGPENEHLGWEEAHEDIELSRDDETSL